MREPTQWTFDKRIWIYLFPFALILIYASCNSVENNKSKYWTQTDRETLLGGLEESRMELEQEVIGLSPDQWFFKSDSTAWSISEIVEHLGLQEDMHYRELYILSLSPIQPDYAGTTRKNDPKVSEYEFNPEKGISDWFVEPMGRWTDQKSAMYQFNRSRDKMVEFIVLTEVDLRAHFTFRNIEDETDFRRVRDLHQIILTTIAHTRRHIHQIERIKEHPNFPGDESS